MFDKIARPFGQTPSAGWIDTDNLLQHTPPYGMYKLYAKGSESFHEMLKTQEQLCADGVKSRQQTYSMRAFVVAYK